MSNPPTEVLPDDNPSVLNAIRTETALSRFPCHRISRKGTVEIAIHDQASALTWKVSYSADHGQPGPLAYKLDTLVINRKIEEAGRPVPRVLRLGNLSNIAAQLGKTDSGTNLMQIRTALFQNAFAGITAKIDYKSIDGTEQHLEAGFNRYAVVFTGEKLPDGRAADSVHLVFSDHYLQILNNSITRPLDFDYMKSLPPAAQRFYEIVSYQIYAALKYQNPRARLLYSEYCLLSTATRYFDFDHVKKQMLKTHKPHVESGYLQKVQYEATTDKEGKPDWIMYYTPGPNASREYQAFIGGIKIKRLAKRQHRPELPQAEQKALSFVDAYVVEALKASAPPPAPAPKAPKDPETEALIRELTAAGLNRSEAELFAETKADECRRQLEYLPYVADLRNKGGYLRRAIEGGFGPSAAYVEAKEAEEEKKRKLAEAETRKARERLQEARRRQEEAETDFEMAQLQSEAPEAFSAFLGYVELARRKELSATKKLGPAITERMSKLFDAPEKQRELFRKWKDEKPV